MLKALEWIYQLKVKVLMNVLNGLTFERQDDKSFMKKILFLTDF